MTVMSNGLPERWRHLDEHRAVYPGFPGHGNHVNVGMDGHPETADNAHYVNCQAFRLTSRDAAYICGDGAGLRAGSGVGLLNTIQVIRGSK